MAGSSPHTRGTLEGKGRPVTRRRFIPAYAGNASGIIRCRHVHPVHPRIRGERAVNTILPLMGYGSSPHTRGTLLQGVSEQHQDRFIPAYAGNAGPQARSTGCFSVHPRIRGERDRLRLIGQGGQRFIPAYAGNASRLAMIESITSVHPRIRGERKSFASFSSSPSGSSPHTRGTP